MVARTLGRGPQRLAVSTACLQAHGTPRHWRELTDHRLIVQRFLSGKRHAWLFREGGRTATFDPEGSVLLSSPETTIDAALEGLGVTVVARQHASDAMASKVLREVLAGHFAAPPLTIAMYYPHRSGMAPRVRALVEHLVGVFPGVIEKC